jgi:hypothetical protein
MLIDLFKDMCNVFSSYLFAAGKNCTSAQFNLDYLRQ